MELTAADIMTRNVICVQKVTTLQELVKILFSKRIGGIPVVDENGELAGIVTKTDIVTHGLDKELGTLLADRKDNSLLSDLPDFDHSLSPEPMQETVEQVMTAHVFTAPPNTGVSELVRMMLEKEIHRIVITEQKRVVGIVTTMNLLQLLDKR